MPTEFVILCGFLGSGKTTLLRDFLDHHGTRDTAVIVNDVGEINVDGAVLGQTGDLNLLRLANGCVCCSLSNDLLQTIEDLIANREGEDLPPFSRIVLECSGISDPAPIVRSLSALARYRMNVKVVCVSSCVPGEIGISAHFEEAVSQIGSAHLVVLSKIDLVSQEQVEAARKGVLECNPFARVLVEADRQKRASALFADRLQQDAALTLPVPQRDRGALTLRPHPRISVFHATFDAPPAWPEVSDWLENAIGYFGDRLLRIKGLLRFRDYPDTVLIQGVGTYMDQPRPMATADGATGLFVIIRDARLEALGAVGDVLTGARWKQLRQIRPLNLAQIFGTGQLDDARRSGDVS
jgi:G3E family GTPase